MQFRKVNLLLVSIAMASGLIRSAPAQAPVFRNSLLNASQYQILSNIPANGQIVASVDGSNNQLRMWDYTTRAQLYSFYFIGWSPRSVAISNDSKYVAIGFTDGFVELYSAFTGELMWAEKVSYQQVASILFSPDSSTIYFLAAGSSGDGPGALSLSGQLLYQDQISQQLSYNGLAISPNGQYLALAGSDDKVYIDTALTGSPYKTLTGHTQSVDFVAFGPTGGLYAGSRSDQTILRWNSNFTPYGNKIYMGANADSLATNPNGTNLAVAHNDGTVQFWTATFTSSSLGIAPPQNNTDAIFYMTYSKDGQHLLTAGQSSEIGVYQFSPNVNYLYGLGAPYGTNDICWNAAGTQILDADEESGGTLITWAASDLHQISRQYADSRALTVAVSKDGKYSALGTQDDATLITNSSGAAAKLTDTGIGSVSSIAFMSDNVRLVTAGNDETVRVWNLAGTVLQRIINSFSTDFTSVATTGASAATQLIATGDDEGHLGIYNGTTYASVKNLSLGSSSVEKMEFTPNGQTLLAMQGHTISIVTVSTGAVTYITEPNNSSFNDFDLSPTATAVCTVSNNGEVEFWNLAGVLTGATPDFATPYHVRYSRLGDVLALVDQNGLHLLGDPVDPYLTSLTPESYGAMGGSRLDLQVCLAARAPYTGEVVSLASSNAAVSVPASVFIAPGEIAADVDAVISPVASPLQVTISANLHSITIVTTIIVLPPFLNDVKVTFGSVKGGTSLTGAVYLSAPAPTGGEVVTLSLSVGSTIAKFSSSTVTVPAGQTSAAFTITTSAATGDIPVTVNATLAGVLKTTLFTITP